MEWYFRHWRAFVPHNRVKILPIRYFLVDKYDLHLTFCRQCGPKLTLKIFREQCEWKRPPVEKLNIYFKSRACLKGNVGFHSPFANHSFLYNGLTTLSFFFSECTFLYQKSEPIFKLKNNFCRKLDSEVGFLTYVKNLLSYKYSQYTKKIFHLLTVKKQKLNLII